MKVGIYPSISTNYHYFLQSKDLEHTILVTQVIDLDLSMQIVKKPCYK